MPGQQAIEEERQIPTAEAAAVADMGPALLVELPGRSPDGRFAGNVRLRGRVVDQPEPGEAIGM